MVTIVCIILTCYSNTVYHRMEKPCDKLRIIFFAFLFPKWLKKYLGMTSLCRLKCLCEKYLKSPNLGRLLTRELVQEFVQLTCCFRCGTTTGVYISSSQPQVVVMDTPSSCFHRFSALSRQF